MRIEQTIAACPLLHRERVTDRLYGNDKTSTNAYPELPRIGSKAEAFYASNTQWQHDLSISHVKIGDALAEQAKTRKARAANRAGLEITETLARQEPENSQWQRDIAAFCLKLVALDCLMTVKTRRYYLTRGRDMLISLQAQDRFAANDEFMESLDIALKHHPSFNWNTARTALKVIGTGLLAAHIIHQPFFIEPGRVAI